VEKGQFEYVIEFENRGWNVIITVKKDFFKVKVRNFFWHLDGEVLSFQEFLTYRHQFLPTFLIGYYSGENKRLKEIVEDYEEKQKKQQRDFHSRKTKTEQSLRKLFFAESFHSQLLLLTLAVYREKADYKELIDDFFTEYLEIDSVKTFDIRFNNPRSKYFKKLDKSADYFLENFTNKKNDEIVENPFWNLKGKINKLITVLFNHHLDNDSYLIYENDGEDKRRFITEFLELKNTSIEEIQDEIYAEFNHPLDFFDALESSNVLEILNQIEVTVKKVGVENPIKFSHLSEGQQQLLSVIGLILISGKDDCLLLLDEPDTHINPKWQRNFVELLKKYNLNNSRNHIFLATHSPLLVQAYEDEDLILFRKKGQEIIIDTENHQIKNWRIDQVLVSEYFDFVSARPKGLDNYMKIKEKIINKYPFEKKDEKELAEFENEFGVLPTGETKTEIRALQLINHFIKSQDDKNKE
jgi:ABC-type multidrug transport system ATPase subunit